MIPWTCGALLGVVVGLIAGARWQRHQALKRQRSDEELTPEDRSVIEAQFTQHAEAVSKQVSAFADVLAGDDPLLRARLRRVEEARGWS